MNTRQYYSNPVKAKLAEDRPVFGMNVRMARTADIARIAKTSSHDFLFIDTQHGIFGLDTIYTIAQTAIEIGVAPIVRCRGIFDPDVSVLLDNGVQGIIFPDIDAPEQARVAVDICKFPPIGKRSVAGGYMMFNFAGTPVGEATQVLNDATFVGVMIETPEGLENVEAIAAVPGIDLVLMGTNDLLLNMGMPGQYDAPEIVAAQARVTAACKANSIVAGVGGNRSVARQARAVRDGVRFLTTQSDIALLSSAARTWVDELCEAVSLSED